MTDPHTLDVTEEFNRRVVDHLSSLLAEHLTSDEFAEFLRDVWNTGEPRRSIVTEPDGTQRVHVSIERPNGEVVPVARFRMAAIDAIATPEGLVIL